MGYIESKEALQNTINAMGCPLSYINLTEFQPARRGGTCPSLQLRETAGCGTLKFFERFF